MDPILEFLEYSAKTEISTGGGGVNFVGMAVLALLIGSGDTNEFVLQLVEALGKTLDRIFHFIEKLLEFIAALSEKPFTASEKPPPYTAPREGKTKLRPLILLAVLTIGCTLAVGGARFASHHAGATH